MKLYMMLLGCKPAGRHTEQHDIFFAVGNELKDFVPAILEFWPEADAKVHIDAYRTVTKVEEYRVEAVPRNQITAQGELKLYFVNLGGYKENEFEEFHYKRIVAADSLAGAIAQAKKTVFWNNHLSSHIDDKYALDVDDVYEIEDLLPASIKNEVAIRISAAEEDQPEDEITNGYFKLSRL